MKQKSSMAVAISFPLFTAVFEYGRPLQLLVTIFNCILCLVSADDNALSHEQDQETTEVSGEHTVIVSSLSVSC